MADFQAQVNVAQAPAVEGDFCDTNPRSSYDAGPGGLVAGPNGVTIGRFAWAVPPVDGDGAPTTVNSFGFGLPSGFVHREQQGTFTTYLAASGMAILKGFGMTLMTSGGYWVKNNGTTEAEYGMKAYANFADGGVTFALAGSPTAGGTSTASTLAAGTASVTGSISDNVLTVTAVGSGTLYPGGQLSGTGVAPNTEIVSQLTGTAGGVGTYLLNVGEQTVTSTTISETYGLLTIGGTVAGTFAVNQLVTGSGVAAGTYIRALGAGNGGAGTYIVNLTQVVSSQAINTAVNVETKYFARSTGLAGEIVKISATTNA